MGSDQYRHLVATVWDAEYQDGKYADEPPVRFATKIITELEGRPDLFRSKGLYAGCGNGRNFVMLAKAGLNVIGLDVSAVGLEQISAREPALANRLVLGDFLEYTGRFGYIIAIQSFQHGHKSRVKCYFSRAARMLKNNGLLFVRVNASDTDIYHSHEIIEKADDGGFTIQWAVCTIK